MARLKALLLFSVLMALSFSVTGLAQKIDPGSGALLGVSATTSQTMVYAPFVANIAPEAPAGEASSPTRFDTTFVISNPLSFPSGLTSTVLVGGSDTEGTLELYCFNQDGGLVFFESSMDPTIGNGLSDTGTLLPGESWTFLYREVLDAVQGNADEFFSGFCYIVSNTDGVAGASNVLGFGVGFAQSSTLVPAVGQGPTPMIGIPVAVP